MTGSWAMDVFIWGCAILIVIPVMVCIYEEVIKIERGECK